MITEENKFLGLEEIKNLIEKVYAAQQAGNYVLFSCSNGTKSLKWKLMLATRCKNTMTASVILKNWHSIRHCNFHKKETVGKSQNNRLLSASFPINDIFILSYVE